jgi:hypothetical protein
MTVANLKKAEENLVGPFFDLQSGGIIFWSQLVDGAGVPDALVDAMSLEEYLARSRAASSSCRLCTGRRVCRRGYGHLKTWNSSCSWPDSEFLYAK